MTQETYLQQNREILHRWQVSPRMRRLAAVFGYGIIGFFTAAVSLGSAAQPLTLGLICALTGWRMLAMALGSMLGYRFFWEEAGIQGMVWSLGGCLAALTLGKRRFLREGEWLLPGVASLIVSTTGLVFQMAFGDETAVGIYWMRVILAGIGVFFCRRMLGGEPIGESRESLSRRFDVGAAQVRLEIMAGVLDQTQQILQEIPPEEVDADSLLARTRERACGSCPNRKGCDAGLQWHGDLLDRQLTDTSSVGVHCKKPNRLLLELRRSQEQLRMLKGEARKRQECRQALVQQYRFLGDYLRKTSDSLTRRYEKIRLNYKAEVQIATLSKEAANGDRCQCFPGVGQMYYVLLCDGMGTGLGAAQEGQSALNMLRQMLTAGFPAEYALSSVNSLCCLRGRAGAVTVDLAELDLNTGKVQLYKWGAAASILLRGSTAEKIGTAGPPPGLAVEHPRVLAERLSLRRGEALILMSDGVDGEGVLRVASVAPGEPLGEMAVSTTS